MATSAFLIHISDLHVSGLAGGGWIPGATGHDPAALEAFCAAKTSIASSGRGQGLLVVSGDVSAHGEADQLALYRTLRNLGFARDARFTLKAFRDDVQAVLDIPGNHDFWDGTVMSPSLSARVREDHFPAPWFAKLDLDRHVVALHGLCSTSGATGLEQVCAVGNYRRDDLDGLAASIADANRLAWSTRREPFNIVVTHHSPSFGSPRFRGIAEDGLAALAKLCSDLDVRGILTGHAHSRTVGKRGSLPPEVRCGTTLQADAAMAPAQVKCFLHHEFLEVGDRLEWNVTPWVYRRRPTTAGAFREVKAEREPVAV